MPSFFVYIKNNTPMVAWLIDSDLGAASWDKTERLYEGQPISAGRSTQGTVIIPDVAKLEGRAHVVECELVIRVGIIESTGFVNVQFGAQNVNGSMEPFGGARETVPWLDPVFSYFTDPMDVRLLHRYARDQRRRWISRETFMTFVLAIFNYTTAAPTVSDLDWGADDNDKKATWKAPYPLLDGLPITANGQLVSVVTIPDGSPLDATFNLAFGWTPESQTGGSVAVQFGVAIKEKKVDPIFGAQPCVPGVGVNAYLVELLSENYLFGLVTLEFLEPLAA